jgi:putative MATE family efflux protein
LDPRTRQLLEAPVGALLVRLAAPNVLVMLAQSSVGLIEAYFVARLGPDALAGVSLVFPALMLAQMVSAGAMGGGILSAIARALGGGRLDDANRLVWHAFAIALGLGLFTTIIMLTLGRPLYVAMGGAGGSLKAALVYSNTIFAGALLLWLFNSLAAVIRGTGDMALPAWVICGGAVALIPLSPALIFGLGPFPAMGVAGGASAVLAYYAIGAAIFAWRLWSGGGVLRPSIKPPRLSWLAMWDILRVGAVSALVSATTNVTVATATGFAGAFGPNAIAGYGAGGRLEYLLVPLVFGFGAPMAALVGTNLGAGKRDRALRAAWVGAIMATVVCEGVGLLAAWRARDWMSLFATDASVIDVGVAYLHTVGPVYGFFGLGLSLYFASQGAGRLGWPLFGGILRVLVSIAGGALSLRYVGDLQGVFLALAAGLVAFGLVNAGAVASGVWFKSRGPVSP